jgi:hypothetical protein
LHNPPDLKAYSFVHTLRPGVPRAVTELPIIATLLLLLASASAAETSIASRYPNDASITNDLAVLFAEDFESGNLKKWDEVRGSMMLSSNAPFAGHACAQAEMIRGKNTGGDAIKWFMPGADRVHVRVYVKFSADYQYPHHFLWLSANPRTNRWQSFGKAGLKPDGTYFSSGMEAWFAWGKNPPPGELNFYSYFPDMEIDPRMNKFWGNSFFPPGPGKGVAAGTNRIIPPLDQWQCWEFMLQANTAPDRADGKQAMWLDGKLIGEFAGIRWRTVPDVKINCFWLEHYGYDSGDPTKQFWKDRQTVWFDNVVIATSYIGPMTRN